MEKLGRNVSKKPQAGAMEKDTSSTEMEKVVKHRKKFKLVPIPGTESGRLQNWLQESVGSDLFIDPESQAAKMTDSQDEWFMVVRHPVDRLVSLCEAEKPLDPMEPNQCS